MNILFIRHAEAIEAGNWSGSDMSRPLTPNGKRDAKKLFWFLAKKGLQIAITISSDATRAKQTASLFATAIKTKLRISPLLNPGSGRQELRHLLREHRKERSIALVGHEPDFSETISALIGDSTARIKLAKGACALVAMDEAGQGTLRWLIPPLPIIGKKAGAKFQSLEKTDKQRRPRAGR